jgi:type III restriction enzyme
MEPKAYQQNVLDDLSRFLALLDKTEPIAKAYERFWMEKNVKVGLDGLTPYQDMLPGVPNVCLKVPTGGGKTFIAANAIKPIFDALPFSKNKAVVWLVPSDAILEQTLKALSDPNHPYRQKIDTHFSSRVEVYSRAQLLAGQNFSPTTVNEQLSLFVLSYDAFRTSKKEGRKAYQENGNLDQFARVFNDPSIQLADTDETALIQIIRHLNPVVIVDESHHAGTPLSKEMLKNFNPCFVLDLTATPRKESNIIAYVDARQLKKENMVKLPVIVYNRRNPTGVISDAIRIRDKLEADALRERENTGRYIRPIVLLQAQSKNSDAGDNATFDKIKRILIDIGIPENQIAIKTAEINELRGVDLLSEDCPIRYIITINALKEGWDCPFAYVLATVANRSSVVDVEQILGRILRLPHTRKHENTKLNISYVVTSSNDFQATLQQVIRGLNNAGFSDRDYRVGDNEEPAAEPPAPPQQTEIGFPTTKDDISPIDIDADIDANVDIDADVDIDAARLSISAPPETEDDELFSHALDQATAYEAAMQQDTDIDAAPLEVKEHMNQFFMNEEFMAEAENLRLPQFVTPQPPSIFSDDKEALLTREKLTAEFSLREKDTEIDFSTLEAEIARLDISETKDAAPKAWKLTGKDNHLFREWFSSQPSETRIAHCKSMIRAQLSKINAINDKDLRDYVDRALGALSAAQQEELQQSPHIYLAKIKHKINVLLDAHREKNFDLWIQQGKITCAPKYAFKSVISPIKHTSAFPKSLYGAEEEMNGLEKKVAWELANLPNIKWWHRNIARSGFYINGYVNAYPDIIAMTASGKILMIEPKGDHLENTESRQKAKIGRAWQNMAGANFRYYMVFENKEPEGEGALRFDDFMTIVREL